MSPKLPEFVEFPDLFFDGIDHRRRSAFDQLHLACLTGSTYQLEALFRCHPLLMDSINTVHDESFQTPLGVACANRNRDVVNFLLAKNQVDVNALNSWGQTPLQLACGGVIEYNINNAWNTGDTWDHFDPEIVRAVMGHADVDPNICINVKGEQITVFQKMMQQWDARAVRILLEFPTLDLRHFNGRAYRSAVLGTDEMFKEMVDAGWVDLNVDVNMGLTGEEETCTLLNAVVSIFDLEKLKLLLSRKENFDPCRTLNMLVPGVNRSFPSPFHWLPCAPKADVENSKQMLDLLLQVGGMDVNVQCDEDGEAPLHIALRLDRGDLVSSLLRHPDINLTLERVDEPRSVLALAKQNLTDPDLLAELEALFKAQIKIK